MANSGLFHVGGVMYAKEHIQICGFSFCLVRRAAYAGALTSTGG